MIDSFSRQFDEDGYRYIKSSSAQRQTQKIIKKSAQTVLRFLFTCVGLGIFIWEKLWRQLRPHKQSSQQKKILVIRVDFIGDVVMTLPAVYVLRQAFPDAQIDMLTTPAPAQLIQRHKDLSHVLICNPNSWLSKPFSAAVWKEINCLRKTLRAEKYDLALSVSGDWASILALISGAEKRYGYTQEAYPFFVTNSLPGGRYSVRQHESQYCLQLIHAAVPNAPEWLPSAAILTPEQDDIERLQLLLAQFGVAAADMLIALHLGSGNGTAKRWPIPYWAALADKLRAKYPSAAIALIGAEADAPLAERAIAKMQSKHGVFSLTGATSLTELIALSARCAILISADSGPSHIAAAAGALTLALHGPTDPEIYGPQGPNTRYIWNKIWCAPCYDPSDTAECRFGNPICMKGITPEAVEAAASAMLNAAHIF